MLSIPHLIVIFVVALVVFGPEKLPELARNIGKVMAEFRRHTSDLRNTFESHLRDLEREADSRRIASSSQPQPSPQPAASPAAPLAAGTVPANPPYAATAPAAVTAPEWQDPPDPDLRRRDPDSDSASAGVEVEPASTPAAHQGEPSEAGKTAG